jgi:Peptidase S46.
MKKFLLAVTAFTYFMGSYAHEGMWMLPDLKEQNAVAMYELGLQVPIDSIYSPNGISIKDAVVHFGGGCTGEIISSKVLS